MRGGNRRGPRTWHFRLANLCRRQRAVLGRRPPLTMRWLGIVLGPWPRRPRLQTVVAHVAYFPEAVTFLGRTRAFSFWLRGSSSETCAAAVGSKARSFPFRSRETLAGRWWQGNAGGAPPLRAL